MRADVDTDQIIPKQFLKRVERSGFEDYLFFDWRFDEAGAENPDFELNQPNMRNASILVAPTQFWLRLQPRACGLGAGKLRLPSSVGAVVRRHFLQQLLQERRAPDPVER